MILHSRCYEQRLLEVSFQSCDFYNAYKKNPLVNEWTNNAFLKSQKRTKSYNIFSQWGVCCKAPVMKRLLHGRGACCQAPCWLAWLIRPRLHQSDIWSLYPKKPPVLEAAAMICPTITSIYLFISHTFLFPDPLDWRIGFHILFYVKVVFSIFMILTNE